MPYLDVSDTLLDPDFCDTTLKCTRSTLTADQHGRGTISTTTLGFAGVVTSDRGSLLERNAVGEHAGGTIWIITRFQLRDAGAGVTADIVLWNGKSYTVKQINDYSTYGRGFIQAVCELIPLAG